MIDAAVANAWTEERVERLKKLWSDGLSASQIAAELGGGVTRNAVIGKVHRLGLRGRARWRRVRQARRRPSTHSAAAAGRPSRQPARRLPTPRSPISRSPSKRS
jgi:GcrA cell cycle regulator